MATNLEATSRRSRIGNLFSKIPAPRATRFFHFGVYLCTSVGGLVAFLNLPVALVAAIGYPMVPIFGIFGFTGSVLSMVSVLIGVAWLERVGLLLVLTSVVMYGTMLITLGGVPVALFFVSGLAISLVQRLIDIRHD